MSMKIYEGRVFKAEEIGPTQQPFGRGHSWQVQHSKEVGVVEQNEQGRLLEEMKEEE